MTSFSAALLLGFGSLDVKARRMLRYWAVTLALYLLCIGLLWLQVARGSTALPQAWFVTVLSLGGEALFFGVICLHARLRINHALIANMQGFHAIIAIVAAYSFVGSVRGGTLLLLLVVLVFCSFTLKPRDSRMMSAFAIGLLGCAMLSMTIRQPARFPIADEFVHFVLASSMLVAINFLTGQFDYLRKRLLAEKAELNDALAQIKLLATTDELTGLPNRRFMNEMIACQAASAGGRGPKTCLILVDVDRFKGVNDRYGHSAGDQVLRIFATWLNKQLRDSDVLARWGGEEFLILLSATDQETAERIIRDAQQQVCRVAVPGSSDNIAITFSAGIAAVSAAEPILEAVKRADKAMFHAKIGGRNTYRVYDRNIEARRAADERRKAELAEAVSAEQFILHYQPQVSAEGTIEGVEALVRWAHPTRGLVFPGEFIAEAEEIGVIQQLGQWVLFAACEQLKHWERCPVTARLSMSVNVSAKQLQAHDFVNQVLSVIATTGIKPSRLKLELTESMLIADTEETIAKMRSLQSYGVTFSLDDFGTGYSSLSYLKRLPLDELKIDKSFVRDMLRDPNDATIVGTIIALAQSLGLSVIAEGVETMAQRDLIAEQGCHHYQGYLWSKPLPICELERLLAAQLLVSVVDI